VPRKQLLEEGRQSLQIEILEHARRDINRVKSKLGTLVLINSRCGQFPV
jgi:hypothetical protein